jgi:hypothetical protein
VLNGYIQDFFEKGVIFHYELDLDSAMPLEIGTPFENRVFFSLKDIPDGTVKKILKDFGVKNTEMFSSKITDKSKLVISFLNEDIASYCFFGFKEQKFKFFKLKPNELYLFDCFMFSEYRGSGAIYSEVNFVINKFKAIGYKKANVQIESFNTDSIKAFSKIDFHKTREYNI